MILKYSRSDKRIYKDLGTVKMHCLVKDKNRNKDNFFFILNDIKIFENSNYQSRIANKSDVIILPLDHRLNLFNDGEFLDSLNLNEIHVLLKSNNNNITIHNPNKHLASFLEIRLPSKNYCNQLVHYRKYYNPQEKLNKFQEVVKSAANEDLKTSTNFNVFIAQIENQKKINYIVKSNFSEVCILNISGIICINGYRLGARDSLWMRGIDEFLIEAEVLSNLLLIDLF